MLFITGLVIILLVSFTLAYFSAKKMAKAQTKEATISSEQGVLLAIELPRENEKTPISAEQMFASLHGLLSLTPGIQEHLSLEIASNNGIRFYVYTPREFKNFVEGQIYAQYPDAEIKESQDYTGTIPEGFNITAAEVSIAKDYFFPIKTFRDFEVDPLAAITSALEKIGPREQVWLQILIRPLANDWQEKGQQYVEMIKAGNKPVKFSVNELLKDTGKELVDVLINIPGQILKPPAPPAPVKPASTMGPRLTAGTELELKSIENKLTKLGFECKIRVVAASSSANAASQGIKDTIASFKQFATANLNSFVIFNSGKKIEQIVQEYKERKHPEGEVGNSILNIEELASIYHLPNLSVETPSIAWTRAKKGEPPLNLPTEDCTYFSETIFRDRQVRFGIKKEDRRRHMYMIGKTGSGKSTLAQNMFIDDMRRGYGAAYLDPHGDAIDFLMDFVPPERIKDVVIFNPGDSNHPVAFNPFEVIDPSQRNLIASGLLDVFKKYFENSWGPRLEYLLMNSFLTLLEVPRTSLLSVIRLLTDMDYQKYIVDQINDDVMKDFWRREFAQMATNPRLITEAISPIQNKVGQFLNNSTIRNIVAQPVSSIRVDEIINEGKIFFVNLATGRIGESNSALLGAMIISQLQFAAMRRVDKPEEERPDFFVYADEFQKFATDSFAIILSEARKYRLNLIMTHQYIEQMPLTVKNAIFGNVGTMVTYGVGPTDALFLEKEFAPIFTANDIINLGRYEMYLKLMIDGMSSSPFSARGLAPYSDRTGMRDEVIRASRERYARPLDRVEATIRKWSETRFKAGQPPRLPAWAGGPAAPEPTRVEPHPYERGPAGRDRPKPSSQYRPRPIQGEVRVR